MAGESNADVYASFGVNSAVMTGSSQEEHESNMLALDVAARDGDDAISVSDQEVDLYGNPDKFADPEDDSRMQVRIGEEPNEEPEGDHEEEVTDGDPEGDSEEFTPLGDAPKDLTDVSTKISQHEQGFQEMVSDALSRGLSQEVIDQINAEYEGDGISEASYAELAKIGYSKSFVDSYISGQEALVNQYVAQVKAYAGGEERFAALHAHLKSTNPEAAQSFETALANRDLGTVKAIVNLAGQSFTKKFGKPAERSVTKRATQAATATKKAEGFATRDEMIKAMSDPRYRHDSVYRREVEQKVIDSKF